MRGIFHNLRRRNILSDVQTLVLDGLAVPADLVTEIITHDSFNVRVLSIRDAQHLNERKLQQALLYSIRSSRPPNTPKLQGLYIFGPKDTSFSRSRRRINKCLAETAEANTRPSFGGVVSSQGAQIGAQWNIKSEDALAEDMARNGDKWFEKTGKIFPKVPSLEWAEVIQACQGIISFDAVLCSGPRHSSLAAVESKSTKWYHHSDYFLPPKVASHALDGCSGCGRAPEGFAHVGFSPNDRFPLVAPPPLHASTIKSAKIPPHSGCEPEKKLMVRCMDCLRARFCESCHQWWCEDCYEIQNQGHSAHSSWESVGQESEGSDKNVKVHMGLCVESCLVSEMMSGAGSNGMWG